MAFSGLSFPHMNKFIAGVAFLCYFVSTSTAFVAPYPSSRCGRFVPSASLRRGITSPRMALSYGDKTGQLSPESKGDPNDKTGVSELGTS